jgi:hypothetical protein
MNRPLCVALAALLLAGPARAADEKQTFEITVAAGKYDRVNAPVNVVLFVKKELATYPIAVLTPKDGKETTGQLTGLGLLSPAPEGKKDGVPRELHFVLPSLKAGETVTYQVTVGGLPSVFQPFGFFWKEKPGQSDDLTWTDFGKEPRPVLRYVRPTFDDSSKEKREQTFKVFHHLYDPTGERLVTNPGVVGLYPHHRGLFYAFNKVSYGDGFKKKADVWHCTGDAYQSHEKTLSQVNNPRMARHLVELAWHGEKKEVFALEEREMTVYNVPGGQLLDFASRVRTTGGPVKLDGDPQHAGFHFRAALEVAEKTAKQTYYVRPDGIGKPGETRNWDPKTMMGPVNLPFDAMSFVLGDQRYTAAILDHPSNPKESRHSERDYGRFGSYFATEVTGDKPLTVRYRFWLQKGEMTVEQVKAMADNFVHPVEVRVQSK